MLKLIGTVEKGQPVLVCVAGNLCSPKVFDQVKLPADMARLYVDYLGKEGPWDMDSLGWQLIDQLKKKCSGPIVLAGYSAGGVIAISAASKAPELFAGLVLSNTGPCSIGHGKPGFADELKANFDNEEYIRTFLGSCFYEKPSPELLETMWKYTRTVDPEAAYTGRKTY
jgi:pimeloyl-ACP methyl ester carboxylesterase